MNKIDVLDRGYVRLVDTLGDDLSVVNAARVSYDKESSLEGEGGMNSADSRLLNFLWKNDHTSPFRHAALTFEVYAPLFIARQWWKHTVASTFVDDQNGWNESSRRYITEDPVFYVPDEWRAAPENSKQGSGEVMSGRKSIDLSNDLIRHIELSMKLYNDALQAGVAPEMARLYLPAYGMYVRYRWTISLHGLMNFIELRKGHGAQEEIKHYADAIYKLAETKFPNSLKLLGE